MNGLVAEGLSGQSPDSGNRLARDERQLEVQGMRQRDEAGESQIDGSRLDAGNLRLRDTRHRAQLALAQPAGCACGSEPFRYLLCLISHFDVDLCIPKIR